MKIAFHGAARTVTGSKHLLTLKSGTKILFDCGMFQGLGKDTYDLNETFGFDAKDVDYLLLSHAHIDHSGLIPKLVKEGFRGFIFCTSATKDLTEILLNDSAHIQREDTRYINKKRAKRGLPLYAPLYSLEDVKAAMLLFKEVPYNEWCVVEPGIKILFTDAGHIIGSAAVHVSITENGKTRQISFSGDVGRYNDVILRSPAIFPQADYIIIESTYGNKLHETMSNTADELNQWVQKTCREKKGKLIIPAFSVGRTQELLYFLNQLSNKNQLAGIPVYVDSPLSSEATAVVKKHKGNFNDRIKRMLETDNDPFDFKELHFIESVFESKQLNDFHRPCVIISASGMADAGRIKHHIKNYIGSKDNTILIAGYCEPASLGAKLMHGQQQVKIYGEEFRVVAEIGTMLSMSAHGDYDDLCQFLTCQDASKVRQVFVVHGEEEVQLAFQQRLIKKGFKDVQVPMLHQSVYLAE